MTSLLFIQTNDETAAKNVDISVVVDGNNTCGVTGYSLPNGDTVYFAVLYNLFSILADITKSGYWLGMIKSIHNTTDDAIDVITDWLEAHSLLIKYRMTSVPGTNESLMAVVKYDVLKGL